MRCSCIGKHTCTCIDIHTFVAKYCYNMFKSSFKILLNISEIVAFFRCKTKGMLHVSNFFSKRLHQLSCQHQHQCNGPAKVVLFGVVLTLLFSPGLLPPFPSLPRGFHLGLRCRFHLGLKCLHGGISMGVCRCP